MATTEKHLSVEQKELVAIGASIGAGCQPCTSHHFRAAHKAGLADDQLLAAVTNAEQVTVEAEQQMAAHARAELGTEAAAPAAAGPIEDQLASIGAALGANDWTNIERHLQAAVALGVSRSQLQDAIEIGGTVQHNAARIHREKAERLLDRLAPASG